MQTSSTSFFDRPGPTLQGPGARRAGRRALGAQALAAAALVLLSACGGGGDDPPAPAVNYDGQWTGTTSQGARVFSMTVANGTVTAIEINFALTGNCSAASTGTGQRFTYTPNPPISANAFSINAGDFLNTFHTRFTGSFTSAAQANGTFDLTFTTGAPAGCLSSGSGTWTATKR